MSLDLFHSATRRWFTDTLGAPTAVQQRGWEAVRGGRHTLIAAPTGSGKTLAAFLGALDDLLVEGLRAPLPDEVRVVYVSPLKALSADIHKNLAEPRKGIRKLAEEMGLVAPRITAAVRTGDTTQSERAAMLKKPPHLLVTTPESLYLLLTAERSRNMLRTARTVIVDEIHAVIGTRRGAHLALTLERLQAVVNAPLLRLGLSATQKPIDDVARWLAPSANVEIIDEGHRRALDLALEIPRSSVETVMANEVWEEYYDRLTALIGEHRTTLVFVNTRRMAERVARHLSDRLGDTAVTAHHGSLSKEKRLDAESRLKNGQLKALVATASLELGIDIGHVDLVCQIGSPHRIATLLQRVGRSGHTIAGMPKGRLFPIPRDGLGECAALLREVRRGALDAIVQQEAPLDVLAQQIVAESSCDDYDEDALFYPSRRAHPYGALDRSDFDDVLRMVADGFATKRGRRGALVHRDEVNRRVRGRRGARMLAITSGGAIPEVADYKVVLEPDDTVVGTLNEDFAIESNAGDIFQLGNASWQILQVGSGTVRVADAKGAPPTIPFWLGEAPARSDELSRAVSELPVECAGHAGGPGEIGLSPEVARELPSYLDDAQRALGAMPSQDTLVAERFFDEAGGMQLVIHAPFGSRINKAWGLALRKRFCRQFNFELQAAATEDAILLSLGPQHSFPLADVFRYLHPATARDILVQALLAAPVFPTRWRWNTTVSLAIPRNRGGHKIPPPLQRAMADDLMAAVFPDAAACPENLAGDRELPDHPLSKQRVRDCLEEAMDFAGLARVLERIHAGEITCLARDTTEPSPLAHEILNAKPYAFLDDAPLEERRTQAVLTRRVGATDLSALDPAAIERVRDEEPRDPPNRSRVAAAARRDAGGGDRRVVARAPRARRSDDGRGAGVIARHRRRRGRHGAAQTRIGGDRPSRLLPSARVGVVRPPPPRAHPSLHAQPPARGDRAGLARRLHALPLRLAARRAVDAPRRHRRPARRASATRRLRGRRTCVGAPRPPAAHRQLSGVAARSPLPQRRSALVATWRGRRIQWRTGTHACSPCRRQRTRAARSQRPAHERPDVRPRPRRRGARRARPRHAHHLRRLPRPRRTLVAARSARAVGRAAGVDAAAPLRRRDAAAPRARARRAVARARPRLPHARGARRDPRRPLRHRHVRRAVRAARRRRAPARDPPHSARRPRHRHQRRRPAQPRRRPRPPLHPHRLPRRHRALGHGRRLPAPARGDVAGSRRRAGRPACAGGGGVRGPLVSFGDVGFEVADGIADRAQPRRLLVRNLDAELFFEGQEQLDGVEAVEPEVFHEARVECERGRIHVSLAGDDDAGALRDRECHGRIVGGP